MMMLNIKEELDRNGVFPVERQPPACKGNSLDDATNAPVRNINDRIGSQPMDEVDDGNDLHLSEPEIGPGRL